MAQIGSITFERMSGGSIPKLASAVEIIDREGIDSTGERKNAKKAGFIYVTTTKSYTSLNDLKDAVDNYALLKGSRVTVIDDLGREVNEVLVVDVKVPRLQCYANSSPTGKVGVAYANWVLKPTQTETS